MASGQRQYHLRAGSQLSLPPLQISRSRAALTGSLGDASDHLHSETIWRKYLLMGSFLSTHH